MTHEEKQLLIKDLSARLPYGLKFQSYHSECGIEGKGTFDFEIGDDVTLSKLKALCESGNNKPYLRPMDSMTEEEVFELIRISDSILRIGERKLICILSLEQMDWLNAHHIDYRGLIPMGLALEATEDMYKIE